MIVCFCDLDHVFVTDGSSSLLVYYVESWHVILTRMATCIAAGVPRAEKLDRSQ